MNDFPDSFEIIHLGNNVIFRENSKEIRIRSEKNVELVKKIDALRITNEKLRAKYILIC